MGRPIKSGDDAVSEAGAPHLHILRSTLSNSHGQSLSRLDEPELCARRYRSEGRGRAVRR